jgi:Glycosyltransferase family 87
MKIVTSRRGRLTLLLATFTTAVTLPFVIGDFNHPGFLGDFRGDLYYAARHLIDGRNPYYGNVYVEHLAALKRAGGHPATNFAVPVYPAPAVLAAVPFALFPVQVACLLFLFVSIGSILLALRVLGVRDIKCVAVTFLCIPVLHALVMGSLEPLFILAAALTWRWRDHIGRAALMVASLVATKLFAWPLVVWMLVTRRFRTAALTTVLAVSSIMVAWGIMGFAGFGDYPNLLHDLTFLEATAGISVIAVLHGTGIGTGAAELFSVVLAGISLAAAWALQRQPEGERQAFGMAIMATLIASPIEWPHYVALVIVPIALLSPSFSPLWLLPLIAWVAPQTGTDGEFLRMLPYLVIEGVVIWRLCWNRVHEAATAAVPAGSAA